MLAGLACSASGLKTDERVILYPALGRAVSNGWEVRLHGIVYEPGRHPVLRKVLRRAIGIDDDDLSATENAVFKERAGYFLVDNERDKQLSLTVGARTIRLGISGANGHFESLVTFAPDELHALGATAGNGASVLLPASVAAQNGRDRELKLEVNFLSDEGLSIISDIDDTIKISDVRNKRVLITNTFCRPFVPVSGIAGVYQRWAREGAQFHYVSASPWQLYIPLSDFTRSNGFPAGNFQMKSFRVKDSTFLSLLKSPEKYKPVVIEEMFRQFPKRRYVLVGDSGEKDPEIYGALARKHPVRVQRILIRDVTAEAADSPRYRKAFRAVPADRWQVFKQPGEINRAGAGLFRP